MFCQQMNGRAPKTLNLWKHVGFAQLQIDTQQCSIEIILNGLRTFKLSESLRQIAKASAIVYGHV